MKSYASNLVYFDELAKLVARMEQGGRAEAAAELRRGISCVNGLTDGWAMLMDALGAVITRYRDDLSPELLSDLESAYQAARKAVYRL
jgi:hypothetical protein